MKQLKHYKQTDNAMTRTTSVISTDVRSHMQKFRRSSRSLQLEQIHTLVMDIETVTRLRQRCFNIWTLDDKEELKSEWQHYNEVIEGMQGRLKTLSGKVKQN